MLYYVLCPYGWPISYHDLSSQIRTKKKEKKEITMICLNAPTYAKNLEIEIILPDFLIFYFMFNVKMKWEY